MAEANLARLKTSKSNAEKELERLKNAEKAAHDKYKRDSSTYNKQTFNKASAEASKYHQNEWQSAQRTYNDALQNYHNRFVLYRGLWKYK